MYPRVQARKGVDLNWDYRVPAKRRNARICASSLPRLSPLLRASGATASPDAHPPRRSLYRHRYDGAVSCHGPNSMTKVGAICDRTRQRSMKLRSEPRGDGPGYLPSRYFRGFLSKYLSVPAIRPRRRIRNETLKLKVSAGWSRVPVAPSPELAHSVRKWKPLCHLYCRARVNKRCASHAVAPLCSAVIPRTAGPLKLLDGGKLTR